MVSVRSRNIIYRVLIAIVSMAMIAGVIFGIYKLVDKADDKTKTIKPSYSVGALTDNGEYKEATTSIYSDEFECQGLTIKLDFASAISYEVFFYDTDGKFISKTESSDKNFLASSVPETATHARIVITPDSDDNGAVEIKWYNKSKYSKQLHITVNKEQKKIASEAV